MNFKGRITHIGQVKTGTGKSGEWKSIEIVVEEDEVKYPQSAVFKQMKSGENVKYIDNITKYNKVGDMVDVEFSLKCNKWKESFFQELTIFKVTNLSGQGVKVQEAKTSSAAVADENIPF